MSSGTHPLRDEVLTALRSLRHPTGLRASPLLDDPAVYAGLSLRGPHPSPDDLAIALCARLKAIIEELQPREDESLERRGCLGYAILHRLFQRGENPLSVQHDLGIGRTHFYELRNEAVDSVATLLVARAAPAPTLPLSEPIPSVAGFVGREAEQAFYRESLAAQNLAVIHGFAGTGKTALAARLATERQQAGHSVIWMTFYSGVNTNLDNFLGMLACALEGLGCDDLHRSLAASANGSRPYPDDAHIHCAVNCLSASQATLCLDDVHLVEDVPGFQRFLCSLAPRQQPARVPLIAAGRSAPAFAQGRYIAPLSGLSDQDAHRLIHEAGLEWLSDKDLAELQRRTEGNPAFIKFFIAWTQTAKVERLPAAERLARAHAFITQLGRSAPSRSFLLSEVVISLDATGEWILERAALCRKPLNLEGAVGACLFPDLDLGKVHEALARLERMNLLLRQGDMALYRLHDLMRHYVLAQLEYSPARLVQLHRLLARYYVEIGDVVEAAFHHIQAGDVPAAVQLLTGHADELIQTGQAAAIVALAHETPTADLPPDQRLAWYGALADAWQEAERFEVEAVA